jgi:glycosyltransferase involved in cell wall biosynthesis
MRILHLVPLIDSYRCFLRELCGELTRRGDEVHVWCNTGGDSFGVDPVLSTPGMETVTHFPFPRGADVWGQLRAARALRQRIDALQPDLIHAHFSASILTLVLAKQTQTTFPVCVGTFQGLVFPTVSGPRRALMQFAEKTAAQGMQRAEVLTSDDLEMLQKTSPNIHAVQQSGFGFGCADRFLDTPRPDQNERKILRNQLGLPPDPTVFLFVGRQVQFKGFDLLIRSFLKACQHREDLHLVLVGAPDPLHDDGVTPQERQTMRTHSKITHAGIQSDVLPWMDAADVLLFPTRREGMPVVAMEALARGLPVYTHPVRGCRELIQDGLNGRFFASHTLEAIQELLTTAPLERHNLPSNHLRRSHWVHNTLATYDDLAWTP